MGYGLSISEGAQFLNVAKGLKDYAKEQAFDAEYNKHLGGIQADPEGYKPTGKYDPKAYNQARLSHIQEQLKDQSVQRGVFELQSKEYEEQYTKAMAFAKQGKAMAELGDIDGEISAYEKAYEQVVDGHDIQISEDGKSYTLVNKLTGQKHTEEYNSKEEMRTALSGAVDRLSVKENFLQEQAKNRIDMNLSNAEQDWLPIGETKDGKQVAFAEQINTRTNEIDKVFMVEGEVFTPEEAVKRGYVTYEMKEKIVNMDYKNALAEKARAEAKYTREGKDRERSKSNLEKIAEGYMVAYDIDKTEAMNMARDDQRIPQVAKELSQFAADEMLDLSNADDAARYRKKREVLLKEWAPSRPSTAKGLPKKKETADKMAVVIGALKKQFPNAVDGTVKYLGKQKYVKKSGIWQPQ